MSTSNEALRTLTALRPPSSRPMRLVYGYTPEMFSNDGFTLELEFGEPALAPGTGNITSIVRRIGRFRHSAGPLDGTPTYEVTITHQWGVTTVIKGLATITASPGGYVNRGDVLGTLLTQEIFLGVSVNGRSINPNGINPYFQMQGGYVVGQSKNLRPAPDTRVRNVAGNILTAVFGGIRYFWDMLTGYKALLVNVDFNGTGTKVGKAALGIADSDYWNVYSSGAFFWTTSYSCACNYTQGYSYGYGGGSYGGYGFGPPARTFNRNPQVWLRNFNQTASSVWLERVAVASSAAGTLTSWDAMLSTWIGGWSGATPEENFFSIRGLAAGTYRLCLYADTINRSPATASTFYVGVNNGLPTAKSTSPTASPQWIEDGNYVRFDVTVPAFGVINLKAYGYFDGLQLQRTG